jgi:hypothetical protein
MTDDVRDPILGLLARLPFASPSDARVELVRARGRMALERRQQKQVVSPSRTSGRRMVDGALYAACVLYLGAAVFEALKLGWPLR